MCVAYPTSDVELETVSEDEIYELQFGQYFAQQVRRRGACMHRPCRRCPRGSSYVLHGMRQCF